MAITTNAELNTAVGNWLNRSDLTARIPEFIALCEARLNRDKRLLKHPARITQDNAFTISARYTTTPADWWAPISLSLDGSPPTSLQMISKEEMDQKRQRLNTAGNPLYYTVVGGNIEVLPTPNESKTGLLTYIASIPAIATASTNWLLTMAPDVYLYGSLVAAEGYVMDDDRMPFWKTQLEEALQELRVSGAREALGSTPRIVAPTFG